MTALSTNRARLLIRPSPQKGESLRGYVSRLSFENGSSPILTSVLRSLRATTEAIPQISLLSGCSETNLRAHGSVTQFRNNAPSCVLFGSAIIPLKLIWLKKKMICPQCLLNQNISMCYWELKDYDVCHVHGCHLISNCEACGRGFQWGMTETGKCQCGLQYSEIKARIASTTRSLLCKLFADATIESITLSYGKNSHSDTLAPLNRIFIASNFLLSILIPAFFQEHLGKIRSISNETCEELLLILLADNAYCDRLHRFISLHSGRSLITMKKATRVGIFDAAIKTEFRKYYEAMPLHEHFFEVKSEILRRRELGFQRTSTLKGPTKAHHPKSENFQLKNVCSQ